MYAQAINVVLKTCGSCPKLMSPGRRVAGEQEALDVLWGFKCRGRWSAALRRRSDNVQLPGRLRPRRS